MRMKITLERVYLAVKVACLIVGIAFIYTSATHYAKRSNAAAQSQPEKCSQLQKPETCL